MKGSGALAHARGCRFPARSPGASRNHLQLAQKNKQFVPHYWWYRPAALLTSQETSTPSFTTSSLSSMASDSNLGLNEERLQQKRALRPSRSFAYIFCNIHPEMSAVVVSVPTPYYAISSVSGSLMIHDVAPGTYMMILWAMGNSDANLAATGRRIHRFRQQPRFGNLSPRVRPRPPQ